jgi:tripartite-type tricarboxylate transporter receptor subunit TctC
MIVKRVVLLSLFASLAFSSPIIALAGRYPDHPVRIIVPFSPGGGTDIQARVLADALHSSMHQTFVVDNKPGASGLIGAQLAAEAPADGYTILFTTATLTINPMLYGKRWNVDPLKDLEPISWLTSAPLVLIVHPSVPARTVPELVALAKKQPDFLTAAINTPGSTSHLASEMFKQKADINVTLVPFKGGGPAVRSVVAGETDYLFATGPSAAGFIRAGQVRALAVTTAKPSSAFPGVPTINTFYPGFEADNWYAMFFRKGVPADIVNKVHNALVSALRTPRVKDFMAREGLDAVGSTPEQLTAQVKGEMAKYGDVIRVGQIRLR